MAKAIRVKCPRCRGINEVNIPAGAEEYSFHCANPECNTLIHLNCNTGQTQLPQVRVETRLPGYLHNETGTYPLREGSLVVGRAAPNSTADIQIQTDDRTMSRQHCSIEVKRLSTGRMKAIISELRADPRLIEHRPLLLDGEQVLPSERIVLGNGDRIILGSTQLTYFQMPVPKE